MGSLGDKFKKLAGDQTRQLLQNFQNAQSSKTRNGYSYGKLNEDGSATLADGTTVQVEVKGRPGQYAPVFNLGNGQGLVDQPEAKFFNIDSNVKIPWCIRPISRTVVTSSDTITITNYLQLTNLLSGESYPIPIDIAPGTDGPRTRFASSGLIYRLTANYFFDFSLDGRHIILCSTSGEPARRFRQFTDVIIDSPACDINFCVLENWQISDGELVYDSINYFKLPASTYSTYSAEPPSEFFNISYFYGTTSLISQTIDYNLPIPIVYTKPEGGFAVDFWVSSGTTTSYTIPADFDDVTTSSGTSYRTTYIKDFLGSNQEITMYEHVINSTNMMGYTVVLPTPFYINTYPDASNPVYVGSYLSGQDVQHIISKNDTTNITSNLYNSSVAPSLVGISNTPVLVSNYCTLDSYLQLNNVGVPNRITVYPVDNFISLSGSNLGQTFVNSIGLFQLPAVSYDNAIISPNQNMVRYEDIKSSLGALGIPEIFQNYPFRSGPASNLSPIALTDSRTHITYKSFQYVPEVGEQTMYQDYLQLSQTNSAISGSFARYPQLCKFGPSKGYSQSTSAKVPILVGTLDSAAVTDQDFSSYILYELIQTDEGYAPSKQYSIPIASNIGNRALLAIVYR